MAFLRSFVVALFAVGLWLAPLSAQEAAPAATRPVLAAHGMVASQEAEASRIGVDILRRGGNAVDAAVAVAFALAVTHPQAGNLGGGGFMLIHRADRNETVAIDYRETAPQAATPGMFLDAQGEADPKKSRDSALSVGVPGTVAGLALALERYGSGRFTLADLIAPAIPLARDGVTVAGDLARALKRVEKRLARFPASHLFLAADGTALPPGSRLVQRDLAATLDRIARDGPAAFYQGGIGEKIVASVRANGGLMTAEDLAAYRPVIRPAVRGSYRGYTVLSMPPPSSGGVLLVEMLNILEGYQPDDPARAHLMVEAMKLAYADRAAFMGDPDTVDMPVARLTSKDYAARLRAGITDRARGAGTIRRTPAEGANTTHFSVVDRDGNAVSNTYTLNFNFGVGLVAEGTGIVLNNELDDFAAKPGAPNAYGLLGGAANAPGPGKRPLSSMTPTVLLKDGKVVLVTGSPGGSRIITTVLQVIVNAIDRGMNVAEAVAAPRLHHQWFPDRVEVEPGFPAAVVRDLERRGHAVRESRPWGSANSIMAAPGGGWAGTADPRSDGALAGGY